MKKFKGFYEVLGVKPMWKIEKAQRRNQAFG